MARGSRILLSAEPRGRKESVILSGTLYPGMLVETIPATAYVGGLRTVRAVSRTAGTKGPIAVLIEDSEQGSLATTVFVSGQVAKVYWPLPGDELNMLVKDVAGTGDTIAIGDKYGANATGSLTKDTGSYASAPFEAEEASSALTADALIWFRYLGGFA